MPWVPHIRSPNKVVLRTGLTFDQSPTNNTDRSPRIPTGDRTIFSVGMGYAVTDNVNVDVAYSYLKGRVGQSQQIQRAGFLQLQI